MDMGRPTTSNTAPGRITIRSTKRQTHEHSSSFEVHVEVEQDRHQVAWTMTMVPGTRVPIQLDSDQRVVLIADAQELLIDSSGLERAFLIQVLETAPYGAE
jgi:hypothetical protein